MSIGTEKFPFLVIEKFPLRAWGRSPRLGAGVLDSVELCNWPAAATGDESSVMGRLPSTRASAKPTSRRHRYRQSPDTDPQSQPNLIAEEASSEVQGMAIREIRGFIRGTRAVAR